MEGWMIQGLFAVIQVPFIYRMAVDDSNVVIVNSIALGACGALSIIGYVDARLSSF